jgi:hypothetical protein
VKPVSKASCFQTSESLEPSKCFCSTRSLQNTREVETNPEAPKTTLDAGMRAAERGVGGSGEVYGQERECGRLGESLALHEPPGEASGGATPSFLIADTPALAAPTTNGEARRTNSRLATDNNFPLHQPYKQIQRRLAFEIGSLCFDILSSTITSFMPAVVLQLPRASALVVDELQRRAGSSSSVTERHQCTRLAPQEA